jgi:hypothetical protein
MLSGWSNLGMAFFFFLPLAIGISSGILPDLKQAIKGTLISLAVFSVFLLVTKLEGLVCVLMALPIILLAILLGWAIGGLIKKRSKKDDPTLKTCFTPILIFIVANFFDLSSGNQMLPSLVANTITLKATPSEIYRSIIAVDTVDVETTFLQKLGLPIPTRCILTAEKVGGLRICIFNQGKIIETIKELKENRLLKMEVTSSTLGRSWLKFNEDIYTIEPVNTSHTQITRTTSYFSNLKPRMYWELMERITIASEQEFVFRNLEKDVQKLQLQ